MESIPEAVTLTEVLDATRSDKTLQKLNGYISSGRFNACKKDPDTKCYSSVFYELSNVNGILLHGQQVVIPHSLEERVVKISHMKVIKGLFLQSNFCDHMYGSRELTI